jgi:hypothetical protein
MDRARGVLDAAGLGVPVGELTGRRALGFYFLWIAGRFILPYVPYEP